MEVRGHDEYKLSIEKYRPHRSTWLPEDNLEHCTAAVEDYHWHVQAKIEIRATPTHELALDGN